MSNCETATVALPALDNTMGALFIGCVLSMALWGAGCVQMYYYYDTSSKDRLWLKLYVFGVWILDTMHQALIIHCIYEYTITHYFDPVFLGFLTASLKDMVMVTAVMAIVVQAFFIYRAWRLSHSNWILTGFLGVVCFAPFVLTSVFFSELVKRDEFSELTPILTLSKSINATNAVADTLIAITLMFLLQRSRTGFRNSETIINKLIMFSVTTGLLTSLCAIGSLVTVSVWPNTFVYMTFFTLVPRLYVNSLYATLNARKSLRGELVDTSAVLNTIAMSHMRETQSDASQNVHGKQHSQGQVISVMVSKSVQDDASMLKGGRGSSHSLSDTGEV